MPAAKHATVAIASAASVVVLAVATSAGGAWSPEKRDREAPTAPANVHVTRATPSSVTVAWEASTDNVGVVGYYAYVNGQRVRRDGTSYSAQGLECGSSAGVTVVAFDRAGNRSPQAGAIVSTAACVDSEAPTAPRRIHQEATTQTAVVLAWDTSTDNVGVVSYGIYANGLPLDSVPTPSATLSDLSCGTTFRFDIDAADAAGNRSQRRTAWVTTAECSDNQPPTAPTGLAVTSRTATGLTVSWSPSSDDVGVAGYLVSLGGLYSTDVTGTSVTLSGLTCNTTYTLRVSAHDAAGNSSSASTTSATTDACTSSPPPPPPPPPPGDTSPPSQPADLGVTSATQVSVSLMWTASVDNTGVTGYQVYVDGAPRQTSAQPGATVAGLACGRGYTFEVDAYDSASNRSRRASVIATTSACADTQAPTPPANVIASSRTADSITLSWSPSTDSGSGVTGYGLYRDGKSAGTSTITTAIFSSLSCNTNYTLALDAVDAAANRSAKTTVMVATTACPDTTAPSAPTALAASNVSQTGLTLTWNASSDNVKVTGYDILRNQVKMASTSSTSSTQTGLACNTSYSFAVTASDAAGNTSPRTQLSASTAACAPSPPPPPPPPPPTPTGSAIDSLSDLTGAFVPGWVAPVVAGGTGGGGLWDIATPSGPGFKFVATDQNTATWNSSTKDILAQKREDVAVVGSTEDWSFSFMLPAAGNPSGVPNRWHAGVLWEFHTQSDSGHHLAIDGRQSDGGPRLHFARYEPPWTAGSSYKHSYDSARLKFDHWYQCRMQIKWSSGDDGFLKFSLDGAVLDDYSGPTIKPGERGYLQFGYYSVAELRNEVWFAGIHKN